MKVYDSKAIRNVGIVGHGHCGKTSLTAALLFTAGASNRLLRVDEGNTLTDFDEEEIQRKFSISTTLAAIEWNGMKVNLLDTPGYNIFLNDTRSALVAADGALIIVDGVAGVEIQTEKVWSFAAEYHQPRAILINKLDRERASFTRALASIQKCFGRNAVPVHLPIGSERNFCGIVDLIRMKAFTYTSDGNGKGREGEIPAECQDEARDAHEALVELIAEGNDALMEEFFEKGTLPVEHIVEGLDIAVRQERLFPVLCASGLHNIGSDVLLSFLEEAFPAPDERKTVSGSVNGSAMERRISDREMPSSLRIQDGHRSVRGAGHVLQTLVRHDS